MFYPKAIPLSNVKRSSASIFILECHIALSNCLISWFFSQGKIIRRVSRSCITISITRLSYAISSRKNRSICFFNYLINNLQVSFHIRDRNFVNLIPSIISATIPTNELIVLHIKIGIVCTILNGPTIISCATVLICCFDYELGRRSGFCSISRSIDPNFWHIVAFSCRLKAIQFRTC